ncbi:DNA primase [Leptospira yanagawae]|uniref:DNA primase n=1 Tax=Leptospira yanagawae TaxID=293069 RepID=A0ABY2LYV7_9LEPT|nr:DNA primase [Leptospira yanagawae]TGL18932.1 DNA primase [Leptospira yanagawae]
MNPYQSFKERVRREVSIDSYINRFVPLRRMGRNLVGICPFHNEKTPSFNVNSEGGFYHCFGCKASGDLFRFVMDYQKVDFLKSLEILSEYSGIPLVERTKEEEESERKKEALYQISQKALEYFQKNLNTAAGELALKYLESRGLYTEDLKVFKIGFGLPGFGNLRGELFKTEAEVKLGEQLGLLKRQDQNKDPYDFFRNRIMFPVIDTRGRVVAFSGRILGESEEAKYINSPNSLIYDKSRTFYNLNLSQDSIRKTREAVIVEGVFDAIGLFRKGIEFVVAPLGTGFTEGHVRILKNMADKVYLMMDSDKAGTKGAFRAVNLLSKEGVVVKVCHIPEGKDPFDYSLHHNKQEIRDLLEGALPASQFMIREILGGTGPTSLAEEKQAGVKKLFEFLKPMEKETDKQVYLEEGARQLGLSFSSLFQDFRGKPGVSSTPSVVDTKKDRTPQKPGKPSPVLICERKMIAMLIQNLELFSFADDLLSLEFRDEVSAFFWDYLYTKYLQNENLTAAEILSREEIPSEYLGMIAEHFSADVSVTPATFKAMFLYHADLLDDARMEELVKEMAKPDLTIEEKNNLLSELSLLKSEKNKRSVYLRTIQTLEV